MKHSFGFMVLSIVLAVLASSGLLTWMVPLLRRRMLDHPNARSSHHEPTPRGGGLAFVIVSAASGAIGWLEALLAKPGAVSGPTAMLALPLLALPLAVVGILDDRHNLSAALRYGAQLATALLLIALSPLVSALPSALASVVPLGWLLPLPVLAFLLIFVTAIINFTNFMDGLDGIVAGCIAVSICALAIALAAPWPLWALVGGLLGFLFWNWSPAKVFMGDVGSTFLGAVFAGLVLQAPSWPEALGLLLVATPLLGDACFCVLRRLLAGQKVLQAHRLHLFQRLHQAGWSHARVSSLYITATALLALTLLIGGWHSVVILAIVEIFLGVWLDQTVAVPFAVASVVVEGR